MKFNHKILLMPLVTALAFSLFYGFTQRASDRTAETIVRIRNGEDLEEDGEPDEG